MGESFADASEAWSLAVWVATYNRSPDFPGVHRIVLRITDKSRGQVAVFRCSLRKGLPANKTWNKLIGASDAHKMCKISVAATDDS